MKIKDKIRVLVAEDNLVVIETIKNSLKDIGFDLAGVASNGIEAVHMALSLHPDVILMDISMPELNGLEATRQIQERCSMPIVILTSHEDKKLIKKASKFGASAYLVKPPKAKEIERAIIMALARHGDLMECWRLNKELNTALSEIKTLRGILPICSFCKSIRNDDGYYERIEKYIRKHSEVDFSHTICPACMEKHYPEEYENIRLKEK